MTIDNFIVMAIGAFAIIFGILVIRYRKRFFDVFANMQRKFLGAPGRVIADGSNPWWVGFGGAAFIFVGVVALFAGIFARE